MYVELVRYNIPTQSSLVEITDFIHDWFFDLEEVEFDSSTRILQIPFIREFLELGKPVADSIFGKMTIPRFHCQLNILHILDYEINDTEKIGSYDFHSLEFDENTNLLEIITNIPLAFNVFVTEFEISLVRSKYPIDHRTSKIFGL